MHTGQPLFPGDSDVDQLWRILKCMGSMTTSHEHTMSQNPYFRVWAHPLVNLGHIDTFALNRQGHVAEVDAVPSHTVCLLKLLLVIDYTILNGRACGSLLHGKWSRLKCDIEASTCPSCSFSRSLFSPPLFKHIFPMLKRACHCGPEESLTSKVGRTDATQCVCRLACT